MKAILLAFALSTSLLLARTSMAQDASPIEGTREKISYSAGAKIAEYFQYGKDLIDIEILIKGIRDVLEEKELSMDKADIESTYAGFEETIRANRKSKEDGATFLAKNATAEGVVVRPSGLQYKILRAGSGKKPKTLDRVSTHFRRSLIDGTEIDSTYERDEPADLGVLQVIRGLEEALKLMPVGSKWQLFIPSDLAYGAKGSGEKIPPHSALIFEIELLEITTIPMKIL